MGDSADDPCDDIVGENLTGWLYKKEEKNVANSRTARNDGL
jgi:hypothetical protein|tara:strand:- start:503 stop:625 length:123 start_codon:yes stop_codon:yes gene_type:complete